MPLAYTDLDVDNAFHYFQYVAEQPRIAAMLDRLRTLESQGDGAAARTALYRIQPAPGRPSVVVGGRVYVAVAEDELGRLELRAAMVRPGDRIIGVDEHERLLAVERRDAVRAGLLVECRTVVEQKIENLDASYRDARRDPTTTLGELDARQVVRDRLAALSVRVGISIAAAAPSVVTPSPDATGHP